MTEQNKDKKPNPITAIPMPENLADMTDEEIEAFAAKIWDGWISDTDSSAKPDAE